MCNDELKMRNYYPIFLGVEGSGVVVQEEVDEAGRQER